MPKILLVEDNEANREMLTRRLERQGFLVCCAIDGPTGVAMAEQELPDLILMDVALGDMDGWEATQLIKARPSTAKIPVIALTAHALKSDRDRSIEVGCAEFDTKPVDLPRLLGKIRACLAGSAMRPPAASPAHGSETMEDRTLQQAGALQLSTN
jgi:CheY-like chemotaxis protein